MNITINKYIEMLTKLAQDHPDAILIYASDDEGNSYERVHHAPCVCQFNIYEREAYFFEEEEEEQDRKNYPYPIAICIN